MTSLFPRPALAVLLLVLAPKVFLSPPAARGQAAAENPNEAVLKEFKRLAQEAVRLRGEGKTTEAIAAAEALLAIERKILPADHPELVAWLGWLAELHTDREEFAAAIAARREARDILRKGLDEADWRVGDARRALEDVERLAGMDREQRARLAEAERLKRTVVELKGAGKYAEAVAAARQALGIHKQVLGERHPETAQSLNNLAFLLNEQGDYAGARPLYEQALGIRKQVLGERHPGTARILNNLATLRKEQGDYAGARPLYEQALDIQKQALGERHPETATSMNNLATLLDSQGDFVGARPLYEQALDIRKQVLGERHPGTAASLNNLAFLLYSQGDYAGARPLYEQALAICKQVLGKRHPNTATSLNNLGLLLQAQGDYAGARPLLEQALDIRKQVLGERHPDTAASLNNLATSLQAQGDYAGARPLYEQALAIHKQVLGERHPDTARSLNDLAHLLQAQGDYAGARPLYEQALAIHKQVLGERHPSTATSLSSLALLLYSQGDYAGARPLYEQALAIYKAVLGERHPSTATSLNNLAELLRAQGDYAGARPFHEQALDIRKQVLGDRHPDTARSLNNLAASLQAQGDYASARPLYEQALAINKQVLGERHPHTATSLNNLATLLKEQGDYAGARPLYEQALAINKQVLGERHPNTARSLNSLAVLLEAQGNYAGARLNCQEAVNLVRRILDLAADALTERQQLAMAEMLRPDLDVFLSAAPRVGIGIPESYQHVLTWKGAILERQRQLRQWRRRLREDPRPEVARDAAEWQALVVRLASRALAQPGPEGPDAWRREIATLTERKEQLEEALALRSAGFRSERTEARRTPEQLQAVLPGDAALIDLLEYNHSSPPPERKGRLKSERRLVAYVVHRDRSIARVELGPVAPIHEAIAAWRPLLRREQPAPGVGPDDPARTLRRLVWEPLEAHLEGVTTVLVAPDGALGLVPLGALPGKKEGSYLIEDYTLALVPVPRMLAGRTDGAESPGPKPAPSPSLLLVGDVDYGGDPGAAPPPDRIASRAAAVLDPRAGFAPLFERREGMRVEIAAIRDSFEEQFPDARPVLLRGARATEDALRQSAGTYRYLHLATHGYFAPPELRSALALAPAAVGPPGPAGQDVFGARGVSGFHPGLLSGLALAGANVRPTPPGKDDGILTALEVAELELGGVELAVLSACETGLGEVAGGEGLLGLQRAFQVAGAGAVVASLWTVPDTPTQNLMSRFYRNHWRDGLAPREALRAAQLEILRDGYRRGLIPLDGAAPKPDRVPPYYWAAFVLSGDGR
jgi:tetratricopeptide (TPR) repeat protein/CHAT domain-containing protein